jgi:deoxyribodipyrimidine photo-lyase
MAEISLAAKRTDRHAQLRALFPDATGEDCVFEGGRSAALVKLRKVDPVAYNRTRNHLGGAVTRLSPYFRHGMIGLHEAAEYAIERTANGAYKFVFELAWRDYWRRVWRAKGDAIRAAIESPKVPLGDASLPEDIVAARTGLACMDAFVRDLRDTGYVHNHARMWFASYVIHHRKINWRDAADWYYGELLDGDWASNHLSWQWVASTFSHKPYIFNKDNLERYTNGEHCRQCTANCPFDASYAELEVKLFGRSSERL